jgi:hypothetical protein
VYSVIDEQPYPYAALGGAAERLPDQGPGLVVSEDVVLQVDRPLRPLDQGKSRPERRTSGRKQVEPGQPGVLRRRKGSDAPQLGAAGIGQGVGGLPCDVERRTGRDAAGEQREEDEHAPRCLRQAVTAQPLH